jgi:uncharacterized protein
VKTLVSTIALSAVVALSAPEANAASFDCTAYEDMNAAEQKVCDSAILGALDERLDSWYRRALIRAGYFDQTSEVRAAQRTWLEQRNACGAGFWCLRRLYVKRIRQLKNYVEHV